jgi:tetratricopeptide (TPR) repeat protein
VKINPIRGAFSCAFFILIVFSNLQAQNLRDPRFMSRAQEGFDGIFNMDYDKAEGIFVSMEKEYPQHPAPALYIASIQWLREMLRRQDLDLNRFLTPTYFSAKTNQVMPAKERSRFFEKIRKSESLSGAILKRSRNDKDARYFLATAYGLRSSFAITIDHKLREAFSYGNKAYDSTRQLANEDPQYYDAYLTMGIYEYIVGSIPWPMRWMVYIIGGHGTKQEGLAHLKLAAEKGQYVGDQAQLVSMVLYVREHRYPEALELARNLTSRFPRSFLFPINLAQVLRLAGRKEEAVPVLLEVEKRIEMGNPNFDKVSRQSFRFNLATEFLYMGKLDPAQERFRKAVDDPLTSTREKALSHLRLCRILSWKGQPAEAIHECQAVLSFDDVENSHDQAKKLLKELNRQ